MDPLLLGALFGVIGVGIMNILMFYFAFFVPALKKKFPELIKAKQIKVPHLHLLLLLAPQLSPLKPSHH